MCPGFNRFENKYLENLMKHQKDKHKIQYSAEFLSKTETDCSESDTEGENSESNFEYFANNQTSKSDSDNKNYCAECVEKTSQIQTLEIAKTKLETEVASTQNALDQSKIECVERTSKIQALNITKFRLEIKLGILGSTQNALEETKVECIEKNQ